MKKFILQGRRQNHSSGSRNSDGDAASEQLFSASFILITVANFFNAFCTQMVNATLPVYVLSIGGNKAEAGLIVGLLAITALLLRPFFGWATDKWKQPPLVVFGSACFGLASIIYSLGISIWTLVLGRVIHGLGLSSYSTASNAFIISIAPIRRRSEAIGLFASANSLGFIFGPALGFYIISFFGFNQLFNVATSFAVIALIVSLLVRDKKKTPNNRSQDRAFFTNIVSIDAFPMAWIAIWLGLAMASVNTFIAIYAMSIGINNPGLYFTVQALALLFSRVFLGRLADKWSRSKAIILGVIAISLAMITLLLVQNLIGLLACASVFGLGTGIARPASMALLADRVPPEKQGRGLATYFIGYDGGHFLGSVAFGIVAQLWGFGVMWPLSAGCTLLSLLSLTWMRRRSSITSA
ncbi:MAG: MFS transporter [Bacillota bacterium]|nr:MFS transporter [Bacillota bacterium]